MRHPISNARGAAPEERRPIPSYAQGVASSVRGAALEEQRCGRAGTADLRDGQGDMGGAQRGAARKGGKEPRGGGCNSLRQVGLHMHAGSAPAHRCRLNFVGRGTGRGATSCM